MILEIANCIRRGGRRGYLHYLGLLNRVSGYINQTLLGSTRLPELISDLTRIRTDTRPLLNSHLIGYFSRTEPDPRPGFLGKYRFGYSDPDNLPRPKWYSGFVYIFLNESIIHIMVLLNKICQIPRKFYKHVENISIENTLHQKTTKLALKTKWKPKKEEKTN